VFSAFFRFIFDIVLGRHWRYNVIDISVVICEITECIIVIVVVVVVVVVDLVSRLGKVGEIFLYGIIDRFELIFNIIKDFIFRDKSRLYCAYFIFIFILRRRRRRKSGIRSVGFYI
jgi:hypothetical protein